MCIPVRSLEGKLAGQELKEHHSSRVDIRARIHSPPADLFRRHVVNAADDLPGASEGLTSGSARDSEIHNLRDTLFQNKDVGWLDIAMYDISLMRVLKSFADLADKSNLVDYPRGLTRRDHLRHALALKELHDHVWKALEVVE